MDQAIRPSQGQHPPGVSEQALEELHPASFGWALHCCGGRRDEAEEVLQSSYLKVLDGRARFSGQSSLRTWLFGVVRRTAQEQRRSRLVRKLALDRWLLRRPDEQPVSPEQSTGDAEKQLLLKRILDQLSPRQRDLLHLVFYQELSVEEAAHVLGIPVGTARTHYARGKAQFRKRLTGLDEVRS